MLSKMSDTGRQQVGKVRMSFNWSEPVNNLSEVFYKTVQVCKKLERVNQQSVQMSITSIPHPTCPIPSNSTYRTGVLQCSSYIRLKRDYFCCQVRSIHPAWYLPNVCSPVICQWQWPRWTKVVKHLHSAPVGIRGVFLTFFYRISLIS